MADTEVVIAEPVVDRVVTVQTGDVVIFRSSMHFRGDQGKQARKQMRKRLGPDIRFAIFGPEWDIAAILRPESIGKD